MPMGKRGDGDILFWVGIMIIISAGSFIYVATIHILPEVLSDGAGDHAHGHGHGPEQKRDRDSNNEKEQ